MEERLELRGDYIQLDQLLKAAGWVQSGGEAHAAISAGQVRVDGQVETRRRAKLRADQQVEWSGQRLVLCPPGQAADA